MKVYHIYPSEESEKAISNYTKQLIKSQREQGLEVHSTQYIAGDSSTLNIDHIKEGDVVHIQHEYNLLGGFGKPFFSLYESLGKKNVKIITTMHNVLSQSQKFKGSILKTSLRKTLYRYQNKAIAKNSDITIVHAEFFKKILVEEYDFQEEKVMVLRQGIREDVKLIPKEQAKEELKLKGNVYLLIGSLVPDHGADVVIRQAKEIGGTILVAANNKAVNDRNDSRIREWLEFNKEIVKEHDIQNVRFDVRDLPYELWWKYFAAADVVLLPYRGGIGSGIFADCVSTRKLMIGSNIKYFNELSKGLSFINIVETDYAKAISKIVQENKAKVDSDFDRYIKEYGLTSLSKKYRKIYEN